MNEFCCFILIRIGVIICFIKKKSMCSLMNYVNGRYRIFINLKVNRFLNILINIYKIILG